jgi:hypothetical protein
MPDESWVAPGNAAAALGVSVQTLRNWAKSDRILHLLRAWEVDLTPQNFRQIDLYELLLHLRPGDHLAVRSLCGATPDIIWHHGVYAGDHSVVHMHPEGNISKVSFATFMGRPNASRADVEVDVAGVVEYSGDTDVARAFCLARALLATSDQQMQQTVYDVTRRQCDRFVAWCRTGRCVSVRHLLSAVPVTPVEVIRKWSDQRTFAGGSRGRC